MEPLAGDILVVGLGVSGEAAALYCAKRARAGDPVRVTTVDAGHSAALEERAEHLRSLGVDVALGAQEIRGTYDCAIVSPGIPPHAALMVEARRVAHEVISEIEFAYRRSTAPWLAVTGTNGKTTVTSMLGHLLSGAGVSATVVGNIGTPAIRAVDEVGSVGALVAEVSSFQLALTDRFHPRVAVLLNITPDHLDWHGGMEKYVADKGRIFARLDGDDTAVIDLDDPGSARFADIVRRRGVRVAEVTLERIPERGAGLAADGMLCLATPSGAIGLVHRDELLVRGDHNLSNALAAAAAASAFGATPHSIAAGLRTFAPIEHRLEPVGAAGGIEYFNDSKATNPDAAIKALSAFAGRPVIMLLGGRNKGSRFAGLAQAMADLDARGVVFGEAADEIAADLGAAGVQFEKAPALAEALRIAVGEASPGTAVVLSPACASFDEFLDYTDRGREFRRLVAEVTGAGDSA